LVGIIYTDLDDAVRQMDIYLIFENGSTLKIASEKFFYNEIKELGVPSPYSLTQYFLHTHRYDAFKFKNYRYACLEFSEDNLDKNFIYFSFRYDKSTSKYFKYDLKNRQLTEIKTYEKILCYESNDRRIFTNSVGEYRLEDLDGNVLSDFFQGFIPEDDSQSESPETYIFLEYNEFYSSSHLTKIYNLVIVNKNGESIFRMSLRNSSAVAITKIKKNENAFIFHLKNGIFITDPRQSISSHYYEQDFNIIDIKNLLNNGDNGKFNISYSNEDIIIDYNSEFSYIYDSDFNLLSKTDIYINYLLTVKNVNNDSLAYIAGDGENIYILDNNFKMLFKIASEIAEQDFLLNGNDFSIDKTNKGNAIYTLGNHDIFLTDFIFYSTHEGSFNLADGVNPNDYYNYNVDYKETVQQHKGGHNVTFYEKTFGVYKLKEKEFVELSDMYLKFYNENMIMTKEATYRNISNKVIYDDLRELYTFPPNFNITLK